MDPLRPSSITRWLAGPPTDCPCGRQHQLGLREILLGPGALDRVGDILPRPEARAGTLLLLADRDTHEAAGARAGAILRSSGWQVREAVLGPGPHADDRALAELRPALSCNPSRIVAVGSGTINDLVVRSEERPVLWQALRERASQSQTYAPSLDLPGSDLDPALLALLLGIRNLPTKQS